MMNSPTTGDIDVLFITRKFPPSVGGMQILCSELHQSLKPSMRLTLVAWGGSAYLVPFWLCYATMRAFFVLSASRTQPIVLLGDGAIAPLGFLLRAVCSCRVLALVHGLDVTYQNVFYQRCVVSLLKCLDGWIVNSQSTQKILQQRGFRADRIRVCYPGGSTAPETNLDRGAARRNLTEQGIALEQKDFVVFSLGRQVPRKGMVWFLRSVFPELHALLPQLKICIAGAGPEHALLLEEQQKYPNAISILGEVSDAMRETLYSAADVLVMPNRPVAGDIEGFGITAVEAAIRGLPVIASNLEGLKDAVVPHITGYLVAAENVPEWKAVLARLGGAPQELEWLQRSAREYAQKNCTWSARSEAYKTVLREFLGVPA